MSDSEKIKGNPLTSTDCFILALEKHDTHKGTSGNTCRYIMELEGKLNVDDFKNRLRNNIESQQLASFSIQKAGIFSVPKWKSNLALPIEVNIHESDSFLPQGILDKKISSEKANLFSFDILNKSNGKSTLIFSWNHLIMDGYGAWESLDF